MLNFKNLFKNVYGDILVARKLIMKRAWELRRKGVSLSNSLKKAWLEAKKLAIDFVTKLKSYKLHINKETFDIKGNDTEDVIDICLDKIESIKGKRFAYNVVNNLNNRWERAVEIFELKGTLTFAQNVFIRPIY